MKRRAFSIVELLVVIATMSILLGLLLPAVQSARESARLTQCQSNMRNVSLATVNFYTLHERFPVGIEREIHGRHMHETSWAGQISPFLEDLGVTVEYDEGRCVCTEQNQAALLAIPAVFRCPSLPNTGRVVEYDTGGSHGLKVLRAASGCFHPPVRLGDRLAAQYGVEKIVTAVSDDAKAKTLIPDGFSKTVLFGETTAPDAYRGRVLDPSDTVPGGSPYLADSPFSIDGPDKPGSFEAGIPLDSNTGGGDKELFSMHRSGVVQGWADGRVSILTEGASWNTVIASLHISDSR